MSTCRICGHHQDGACCERCHEVHARLEKEHEEAHRAVYEKNFRRAGKGDR